MKTLSPSTDPQKAALSQQIAEQTAAFHNSGGKVEQVPFGVCRGWVDLTRQYPAVTVRELGEVGA